MPLISEAIYVLANSPAESMNLTAFNVSLRSNLTSGIWSSARIPVQNLSAFDYTHLCVGLHLERTRQRRD